MKQRFEVLQLSNRSSFKGRNGYSKLDHVTATAVPSVGEVHLDLFSKRPTAQGVGTARLELTEHEAVALHAWLGSFLREVRPLWFGPVRFQKQ